MKTLRKLLVVTAALATAAVANADVMDGTYEGMNAAGNCSGGPHGLWTNTLKPGGGSCANYFGVDGLFVTLDGDSGSIVGSVVNPAGISAYIDVILSDRLDAIASGYKNGGGPYNAAAQDFFASLEGTIWVDINNDNMKDASEIFSVTQVSGTYVQVGDGANDKNSGFGLSTWLTVNGGDLSHWDINLNLKKVSEPATLVLLGLGLMGVGVARRRRTR